MKYYYLDTIIKERGITRKKLAESIGISYNSLSKRIIGLIEFDLKELRAIVDYLNLSIEEFRDIFLK